MNTTCDDEEFGSGYSTVECEFKPEAGKVEYKINKQVYACTYAVDFRPGANNNICSFQKC